MQFLEIRYTDEGENYTIVNDQYFKYVDITAGYLHYRDILSNGVADKDENLVVITSDGTQLDDIHINFQNHVIQLGCVYGKTYYVRGLSGKRELRCIESERISFNILFGFGISIQRKSIKDKPTKCR